MIEFYNWLLFIIVCLIVLFPILGLFVQLSDEGEKAGKASYLTSLSVLLSGLVPIVGNMVLPIETLLLSLQIYIGLNLVLNLVLCIFYIKNNKHFLASFLLLAIISLFPYIANGQIVHVDSFSILSVFDVNFPMILFSFWLPILIIVIIASLLVNRHETINYIQTQTKNDHYRNTDFDDVLTRKSIENLSSDMLFQYDKIQSKIADLTYAINTLKVNEGIRSNTHLGNKTTQVETTLLQQVLYEIQSLKSTSSQLKVSNITVTNQVLIKELTHFIATPLATIETSCKLIDSVEHKGNKMEEYLNRIISSVNICKGIMATYREIFLMTKSDDNLTLSELICDSFNVYNGKNLKLDLQVLDTHDNLGNYYIMSTLFPLLTNAVAAAPNNSIIEIKETNNMIILSNDYEGDIDISNFNIEGYSSKPDHKGMGLYTVKHLLARRNLGALNSYIKNNRIYFEIPLVNNEKE